MDGCSEDAATTKISNSLIYLIHPCLSDALQEVGIKGIYVGWKTIVEQAFNNC